MSEKRIQLNSENLVILRDTKGWKQKDFIEKFQEPITRQSMSRWENMNPTLPREKLKKWLIYSIVHMYT